MWSRWRRKWLIGHCFLAVSVSISLGCFVPEQNKAKKYLFQVSRLNFFFKYPSFFSETSSSSRIYLWISSICVYCGWYFSFDHVYYPNPIHLLRSVCICQCYSSHYVKPTTHKTNVSKNISTSQEILHCSSHSNRFTTGHSRHSICILLDINSMEILQSRSYEHFSNSHYYSRSIFYSCYGFGASSISRHFIFCYEFWRCFS